MTKMSKEKVELEQISENEFRVVKLTNRIEPMVGSTIDRRHAKDLVHSSRVTVVINPKKN